MIIDNCVMFSVQLIVEISENESNLNVKKTHEQTNK